jgi:hypothetical protein
MVRSPSTLLLACVTRTTSPLLHSNTILQSLIPHHHASAMSLIPHHHAIHGVAVTPPPAGHLWVVPLGGEPLEWWCWVEDAGVLSDTRSYRASQCSPYHHRHSSTSSLGAQLVLDWSLARHQVHRWIVDAAARPCLTVRVGDEAIIERIVGLFGRAPVVPVGSWLAPGQGTCERMAATGCNGNSDGTQPVMPVKFCSSCSAAMR